MELFNGMAVGSDVTVYNILGPIVLAVLVFCTVLLHRPRNSRGTRSGGFISRVRASVAAGYQRRGRL